MKNSILIILAVVVMQGCMIVRPGQIGYIQKNGKLLPKPELGGTRWFNPFVSKEVKINISSCIMFGTKCCARENDKEK